MRILQWVRQVGIVLDGPHTWEERKRIPTFIKCNIIGYGRVNTINLLKCISQLLVKQIYVTRILSFLLRSQLFAILFTFQNDTSLNAIILNDLLNSYLANGVESGTFPHKAVVNYFMESVL